MELHKLLEVVRSTLSKMDIPKQYWEDIVLTTCYLINVWLQQFWGRLSHPILFSQEFVFSSSPHMSGCVTFVHHRSISFDVFDGRAIKCIFVSYFAPTKRLVTHWTFRRLFIWANVIVFKYVPCCSESYLVFLNLMSLKIVYLSILWFVFLHKLIPLLIFTKMLI